MAVALNNGDLCFPSEFLSRALPTEFPYEDHSIPELTHLFTASTMHQNPNSNSIGTDFKSLLALSGSMAASGSGSWEKTRITVGQVARWKMDYPLLQHHPAPAKGFGSYDMFFNHHSFSSSNHCELEKLRSAIWGRQKKEASFFHQNRENRAMDLSTLEMMSRRRVAPPIRSVTQKPGLQFHHRNPPPALLARCGLGEKKGCAGTGVFIPRRYANPSPNFRNKKGCCSTAISQTKNPVSAPLLSKNDTQEYKYSVNVKPIVSTNNLELYLPQEWTY